MTLFGYTLYDVLQTLIIAIILTMSVLHVTRKLAPKWAYGRQAALAGLLSRSSRPALIRRLGQFMQPALTAGGGCGSGCNTCASCESNPDRDTSTSASQATESKPLKFTRHI